MKLLRKYGSEITVGWFVIALVWEIFQPTLPGHERFGLLMQQAALLGLSVCFHLTIKATKERDQFIGRMQDLHRGRIQKIKNEYEALRDAGYSLSLRFSKVEAEYAGGVLTYLLVGLDSCGGSTPHGEVIDSWMHDGVHLQRRDFSVTNMPEFWRETGKLMSELKDCEMFYKSDVQFRINGDDSFGPLTATLYIRPKTQSPFAKRKSERSTI